MLRRTFLSAFAARFASVRTTKDWEKRRAEVLRAMQSIMGPLPGREKRCPLDVRVEEETDAGSYVRQLITYASEPDNRVPAYLLKPKTNARGGVLCLHPTDDKI